MRPQGCIWSCVNDNQSKRWQIYRTCEWNLKITTPECITHFGNYSVVANLAIYLWHSDLDIRLMFDANAHCRKLVWHLSIDADMWSPNAMASIIYIFVIYSRRIRQCGDAWDEDDVEIGAGEGEISMQLHEHDDTLMAFNDLRWLNCIRHSVINNKM